MIESTLTPALEAWHTDAGRHAWRAIGDLLRTGTPAAQIADSLEADDHARRRIDTYAAIVLTPDPPPLTLEDGSTHVGLRLALVLSGYANPADRDERRAAVAILRRRLDATRALAPADALGPAG